MTRLSNTAETGLADGTVVTLANSDDGSAGDAFSNVTIGAGTNLTFESAAAHHGSLGYRFALNANSVFVRLGTTSQLSGGTMAVRFYFRFSAIPSAAIHIGRLLNSGAGAMLTFRINASGTFQLLSASSVGMLTTSALSANTLYRVECWVTPGTTTTTGRIGFRLFTGESTTSPIGTLDSTTSNLGTTQAPRILEIGRSSGTATINLDVDDMVSDDGIGETFVGPVVDFNASGTTVVSSSTSGSPTLLGVAAGATPVVSDASGSPTLRADVTGFVPVVSDSSGSPTLLAAVSGMTPVVSGTSGTVTALHAAVGVTAAVSGTGGTVTSLLAVSGTTDAVTETSGDVTAIRTAAGTVIVVSSTSGAATINLPPRDVDPRVVTIAGHPAQASIAGSPAHVEISGHPARVVRMEI